MPIRRSEAANARRLLPVRATARNHTHEDAKPNSTDTACDHTAEPTGCGTREWRGGIGVLGDSYSDEYQFYPPHRSTARNWVEILAATRGLNFGRFSTAESRRAPQPGLRIQLGPQ